MKTRVVLRFVICGVLAVVAVGNTVIYGDVVTFELDDGSKVTVTTDTTVEVAAPVEPDPVEPDPVEPDPVEPDPGEPVDPPDNQMAGKGMNLHELADWSREWVFLDIMRVRRAWISTNVGGQPWDNGGQVREDEDGWPIPEAGQAAVTLVYREIRGHYPGGRYICTYEGRGSLVFGFDARVTSSGPARIELDVTPSHQGIYLRIENVDQGDHVRNVVIRHEDPPDGQFHPLFVERLKPFKVLRFMDWQRTNGSPPTAWDQRTTPQDRQNQGYGAAVEVMVDLCNELAADPWFCMPHDASDEYVREFAKTVLNRLHPRGRVYIEWSNEVWNTQFKVHGWVKSETDNDTFSNAFFDKWAGEARRDFRIWMDVWGTESPRIVRVAAGQAALVWATRKFVDRLKPDLDAISCSTYFGLTRSQEAAMTSSTTADQIVQILDRSIENKNRGFYQSHDGLRLRIQTELGRPVALISYEGGQHLADSGQNKPHRQALIDAQSHPLMFDLYLKNIAEFESAGGSLDVLFNYVGSRSKWGSWGHLLWQDIPLDDPGAQKYRAAIRP